ncbi:MAG: MBL fold metallo-hydrolase [Muribaculaceae bacterium]
MEIEFLGTGTSTGIPQIGCDCKVCHSIDNKDKRLRTSAIFRKDGVDILIDCGPDFRTQILRASSRKIDALLVTHSHYDHVGGIDDLRPYCDNNPFSIYCQKNVIEDLMARIPYCFKEHPYPGVPSFNLIEINDNIPFFVKNVRIEPIQVMHFKLPIVGYKIDNVAYITDAKSINKDVIERLKDIPYLIINALRIAPHISHMSLSETLSIISQINPKKAYLIHVSHDMGLQKEISITLPSNVEFAYDGLILKV